MRIHEMVELAEKWVEDKECGNDKAREYAQFARSEYDTGCRYRAAMNALSAIGATVGSFNEDYKKVWNACDKLMQPK